MNNAAILNILIKTKGAREAARDLAGVDAEGRKAEDGTTRAASGMNKASAAASSLSSKVQGAASAQGVLSSKSQDTATAMAGTNKQLAAMGSNAEDASSGVRSLGSESSKASKHAGGLNSELINTNQSFTSMRNVMSLIKLPALAVGAGAAAQGISALGAGLVALTSALGPATGAVAAFPALGVAAAQGMGVFKLATTGVGKAIGDLNEPLDETSKAFKQLTPEAQAFARTVQGMKAPIVDLQRTAQANLFGGLTAGIRAASRNIGVLKPIVAGTAQALGDLARMAGELVGSKGFGRDLATVGQRNVRIITTLGEAGLRMADALRHVIVAAGPLVNWLVGVAGHFATLIDRQAKAGRESGRLAAFFEQTRAVLTRVGSILGHLVAGFYEIGKAAAPLGRQILEDIDKLAGRFEEWTKSIGGKQTLAQYFRDAKTPLYEAAGLIGDIGRAFFAIGNSKTLTPMLQSLRELVPVLQQVITSTSATFGPVFIESLTQVARLFGSLAGANGPLTLFVQIIGMLAGAFADLQNASPVLNSMTISLIGFAAVMKALNITAAVTGFRALFTVIAVGASTATTALIGEAAAANTAGLANIRLRVTLLAAATAHYVYAAASRVASVATALLGATMLGLPVVAIAAAVIALGTAFYLAYKKIGPFHDAVDAAWDILVSLFNWAKANWPLLLAILAGPFGLAALAIIKNIDTIKNTVIGGFNAIVGAVKALAGPFVALGSWVIHRIVDGIHAVASAMVAVGGWIKNRISDGLRAVTAGIVAHGGWVLRRIVDGIHAVAAVMIAVGGWIRARISDGLNAVVAAFLAQGGWIIRRIVDGIHAVAAVMIAVGGWIRARVSDGLNAVVSGFIAHGGWVIHRIVDGVHAVADSVIGVGGWIRARIADGLISVKDAFIQTGASVMDWIIQGLKSGINKLIDFINDVLGVIRALPGIGKDELPDVKHLKTGGEFKGGGGEFARGGAFARTGGKVAAPITLMGEEAPRYPEYVIPTNPAYRKRAQGLAVQAAEAVGMAEGGTYSVGDMSALWSRVNRGLGNPDLMGAIGMAESGGRPGVVGPPSGRGLWQIEWNVWANTMRSMGLTNAFDPVENARMAGYILRHQGINAWVAYTNGTFKKFLGANAAPGVGPIGDIVDMVGDFLGKLPGVGDLPDWLKGTGKWILGKAKDFITSKADLLGGGDGGGASKGPKGIGHWGSLPMANWVIEALQHAQSKGVRVVPTSGYRSHATNVAAGRTYNSEHEGTQYPHGAVDFGGYTTGGAMKRAVVAATRDFKYPLLNPIGFHDEGHASGTGHKMGGIYKALAQGGMYGPYIGSYAQGGVVPQTGFAQVHKGETITSAGDSGDLVAALNRNTASNEALVTSGIAGVVAALADGVNGQLGSRAGLGLMMPSSPGQVARH